MKKLLCVLSAALLLLLVGCESTSFVNFRPYVSQTVGTSLEFKLVSDQETVCKVYKVTEKESGRVFYSLSAPMDWGDDDDDSEVSASDLIRNAFITEQNAKDVIAFITQLESVYSEKERKDDGVLYDLRIVHSYTYYGWTTDAITTTSTTTTESGTSRSRSTSTDSNGNVLSRGSTSGSTSGSSQTSETTTSQSYGEIEANDTVLRIQLRTEENEDEMLLFVSDGEQKVDLADLKGLQAALSK